MKKEFFMLIEITVIFVQRNKINVQNAERSTSVTYRRMIKWLKNKWKMKYKFDNKI